MIAVVARDDVETNDSRGERVQVRRG